MLVKKWMTKDVITVDAGEPLQQAINLMKERMVQLLPVLKEGQLVGVISDGDIKKASAEGAAKLDVQDLLYHTYKKKIRDVMTKDPVTVPIDYTVDEAAQVLLSRKVSGAPVVDHKGRLAGIITRSDIFKVLISLTAAGARGIQFGFHVRDKPGAAKELIDIIRVYGGRTASVLSSYEDAPPGHRSVFIRTFSLDRAKLPQVIKELKEKATILFMVDHRENKREIFE